MSSIVREISYNFFTRMIERLNNFNHLKEKNVTYYQHLKQSLEFAKSSLLASIIFIIHAFYPDIFIKTGSSILEENLSKIQK